ncbi:hypothetical protein JOF29_008152 [Kribbella aluminosa]|uniref:DUF222 domain-containing protein n=1 Tax=Kribbella aluminosa TaxID=416017 RepID=A0ABS4UZG9_9ACTN|nr:HNH endonuclease signature motif containing protein [Kribbella aluminosa]MBP2357042.1 hypothetical protein [Kribbella aluminosa]
MFDPDLDDLDTTDLLAVAAEYAHDQEQAAVGILRTTLAFADRNAVVEWVDGEPPPGYERIKVYGGEGCPGVAEFAPIELGAVLRMSSGAAASLIGEALALRHRLPRVWAAVLAGNAVAWRARKIAHACLPLPLEAAALVDQRVAGLVNTVTPGQLAKIVTAAFWQAAPERAQAYAEATARTRGVFVSQSDPADDHGTKRIWVRAATGAVIRFDATIDDLAHALKALGDTDTLDERRAKAIDWIADPAAAQHLLEVARHLARTQPTEPTSANAPADPAAATPIASTGDPRPDQRDGIEGASVAGADGDVTTEDAFTRLALAETLQARLAAVKHDAYSNGLGGGGKRRQHTLYVHLTDHTLATGNGVLRVEELGPLLAGQLTELLGHDQVIVKPVIDLHDQVSVHSYEIPDRIRERVRLRHPVDMFPYGAAEATPRMDQDHITPYDRAGPPGQTSIGNLIPQSRLHHRAKTHGGWSNRRLPTGAIEWTSPHGFRFHVDHTGTRPLPHRQPGSRRPRQHRRP